MTVYIVWFNNFHGDDEFQGVFSTMENAQAYVDRHSIHDRAMLCIVETSLDDSY